MYLCTIQGFDWNINSFLYRYQAPAYVEQHRQPQHLQQAPPPQRQPHRAQGQYQQLEYEGTTVIFRIDVGIFVDYRSSLNH